MYACTYQDAQKNQFSGKNSAQKKWRRYLFFLSGGEGEWS